MDPSSISLINGRCSRWPRRSTGRENLCRSKTEYDKFVLQKINFEFSSSFAICPFPHHHNSLHFLIRNSNPSLKKFFLINSFTHAHILPPHNSAHHNRDNDSFIITVNSVVGDSYSAATDCNFAPGLVSLMLSSFARFSIRVRVLAPTLWATSAAYFLFCINNISKSLTLEMTNLRKPLGMIWRVFALEP